LPRAPASVDAPRVPPPQTIVPAPVDATETPSAAVSRRAIAAPALSATGAAGAHPDDRAPSIAAELALLEQAQAALRAQAPARALVVLNEHAAKYPRGALSEERNGLRVLALCDLGRSGAAQAAERFVADHPSSPLAGPVRDACTIPRP
jgi:hypothetical protein